MGGRRMMWWRRNAGAAAQTQTAGRRISHNRENTFFAKRIRVQRAVNPGRMLWVVAEERRRSSADPDRGTADQPLPRKHPFCKTNSRSARAKSKEDDVVAEEERRSRSADPDRGA